MTVYNWLSLFGIPAIIFAGFKWVSSKFKTLAVKQAAQDEGLQALLRDRLYQLYRVCKEGGGAGLLDRENFQNIYNKYHTLGANGVMDDIKNRFLALPIKEDD